MAVSVLTSYSHVVLHYGMLLTAEDAAFSNDLTHHRRPLSWVPYNRSPSVVTQQQKRCFRSPELQRLMRAILPASSDLFSAKAVYLFAKECCNKVTWKFSVSQFWCLEVGDQGVWWQGGLVSRLGERIRSSLCAPSCCLLASSASLTWGWFTPISNCSCTVSARAGVVSCPNFLFWQGQSYGIRAYLNDLT